MNKFSKILVGTLCAATALGAVGGVCYNQIPSFKSSVDKAFKNNDNKANIGISGSLTTPDEDINTVKPITPEEFATRYKFALPTTFLGGELYVKVMTDGNLVVSSSVGSGLLLCKVETGTTEFINSSIKYGNLFYNLSNKNVLIWSSVLAYKELYLYDSTTKSIRLISDIYAPSSLSSECFLELSNGDVIFGAKDGVAIVQFKVSINSLVAYSSLSNISGLYETLAGKVLFSYNSSSSSYLGVWMFDPETGSVNRLSNLGYCLKFYGLSNGNVLISGSNSSIGLSLYSLQNDAIISIKDTGSTYLYSDPICLDNGRYLISSYNSSYKGLWLFDSKDNSFELIESSLFNINLVSRVGESILLLYSNGKLYAFNIETYELTLLVNESMSFNNVLDVEVLSCGDILISTINNNTGRYVYRYSVLDNQCVKLLNKSFDLKLKQLSNGNCLIYGAADIWLYDANTFSTLMLLTGIETTDIIEQEDGTYLIKSSGDFDYEYNPEDNSMKLVYIVTQAE